MLCEAVLVMEQQQSLVAQTSLFGLSKNQHRKQENYIRYSPIIKTLTQNSLKTSYKQSQTLSRGPFGFDHREMKIKNV